MLGTGTGLRFGGEDRLYIPAKARKGQNQQQKQVQGGKREESADSRLSAKCKVGAIQKGNLKDSSNPMAKTLSNLDRFLESTRPSIPAQYLSKTTLRSWKTCDVEYQPYFTLGDLWESFKEWSAYGAGVPLVLDGSDSVIQYYVPYLSGIQLYGETTGSNAKSRQAGDDSDGDSYSGSDGSSDYEFENSLKFSTEQWAQCHMTNKISSGMGKLAVSNEKSTSQEGFSSDDNEVGNTHGRLLFEFLERDPPYLREPLADKICDLARHYPALYTLRSCDLMPLSWICVAWYPIYRIPTGSTLRHLDACFLTYHYLSTPVKDGANIQSPMVVYPSEMDGIPMVTLPVFGMAFYKFKGSMWTQNGVSANSLMQGTDNWLRLLQVNHPDFQFFASRGMYRR